MPILKNDLVIGKDVSLESPLIRKARLADSEALASCIDAAYSKYADQIPDMPRVSEGVADEIANNQVWVADLQGEIVAGLFLVPQNTFMKLANLAVHPSCGGKGIGHGLLDLAEKEAVRQGFDQIRLNTHIAMPGNVAFYERLGWRELSRRGSTVAMIKYLQDV